MRVWARLNHQNLAIFYGYIIEGKGTHLTVGFVSQWHPHGNVMKYVRSKGDANKELLVSLLNFTEAWANQHEYQIHDIASGLLYLHSLKPPIVHGDMKPVSKLIIVFEGYEPIPLLGKCPSR